MNEIPVGGAVRIIEYTAHNEFTERLREFGLIVGTEVKLLRRAPLNGPIEIQFGHSQIVVRPDELAHINVQPL